MTDPEYDIQTLVELSGVPRRTIYFYTQQGIIPPPSGAGLAARYSEIHLLRLRLVPVLRRQGQRLDAIRRHLDELDLEGLRQSLNSTPLPPPPPLPVPLIPRVSDSPAHSFLHYTLPAGITLVAPADLTPVEQQKLGELLQAAQNILG